MADDLHSFLDILADVAKQQEDEEKQTAESGSADVKNNPSSDSAASSEKPLPSDRQTTVTHPKSTEEAQIANSTEEYSPDFFKSAISNAKKNTRSAKKRSTNGEVSIFDQISKNQKTVRTARKSTGRTTRRTTTTRRKTSTSSGIPSFRIPRTSTIIKKILGVIIDLIFGRKSSSSGRNTKLSGYEMLNSLLGSTDNTASKSAGLNQPVSSTAKSKPLNSTDQKLLTSVVKDMFGNGKSSNADFLPVFKDVVRSVISGNNQEALNSKEMFSDEAAKIGYTSKESEGASAILGALLNSNLSNKSIAMILQQFTETEDDDSE